MKKISTLLFGIALCFQGYSQNDVGCNAILKPLANDTIFSNGTSIDPQYTRKNFGTNTIPADTTIMMRFYVNGVKIDSVPRPVSAGDFTGGAEETRTIGRTIDFTLGNLTPGVNTFCVSAHTANDVNRSNDTSCINFIYTTAVAEYDVELVDFVLLDPNVAAGGDVESTSMLNNVGFKVKNVGTRNIPSGFLGQVNVTCGTALGGPYNVPISAGLAVGATSAQYAFSSRPSSFPTFPTALGSFQTCAVWLGPNDPNNTNNSTCETYNLVQGLSVTAISPTSGWIGSTVTITGVGFSATPANNTVKFNGTTAVVTASTSTSITCTVPEGATTGKISVTVAGRTKESPSNFLVLPNAVGVSEIRNEPYKVWYSNGTLHYDLASDQLTDLLNLKVYNASGALVFERVVSEGEYAGRQVSVNVSELPAGIYMTDLSGMPGRFIK